MAKHNLRIAQKDGKTGIYLDNFKIEGVMGYEVKSSDHKGMAELSLKIMVNNLHLGSDDGGNDIRSDFADRIE